MKNLSAFTYFHHSRRDQSQDCLQNCVARSTCICFLKLLHLHPLPQATSLFHSKMCYQSNVVSWTRLSCVRVWSSHTFHESNSSSQMNVRTTIMDKGNYVINASTKSIKCFFYPDGDIFTCISISESRSSKYN